MFRTGCVERVSALLNEGTDKKVLTDIYDELLGELNLTDCISEDGLGSMLKSQMISRCFQVEWCIPQAISGDFLAIR